MKSTITLILAIVVASTISAECSSDFNPNDALDKLCKNKEVKLSRTSELKAIFEILKNDPEGAGCSKERKEAILSAEEVLRDNEDVCSSEKTDAIRNFHLKYISIEREDNLRKYLPKSLDRFMIGYGLKVSSICKKNMINSLISDSHALLSDEDFNAMDVYTNDRNGVLSKLSGKPKDFNDIILASDLFHLKLDDEDEDYDPDYDGTKNMYIRTGTGPMVKKMQLTCNNRFKPFYDKLIIPLVKLADLGYNYKGEDMQVELEEMQSNQEIGKWYSLVYLCEMISNIRIVDSTDSDDKLESADTRVVNILSDEEASLLQSNTELEEEEEVPSGLEKINYKEGLGTPMDDLVIEEDDENFSKLIKSFDKSMTMFNRVKAGFLKKVASVLQDCLTGGKIDIRNSFLSQTPTSAHTDKENKENMVKAIDDFITSMNGQRGTKIKYGVRDKNGKLHELKQKKRPWWKLTVRKFKKIVLGSVIIGIGVIVFLGLIGIITF